MEGTWQYIMKYLTKKDVLDAVKVHGCEIIFINKSSLLFVIDAVKYPIYGSQMYPTLFEKAAAYAYIIIDSHVFENCNKRTALHCVRKFLELNDCLVRLDIDDEIINLGHKIANKCIKDIVEIAKIIKCWVITNNIE